MKAIFARTLAGVGAGFICVALVLSVAALTVSIEARVGTAGSFCATRIRQVQDTVWLCSYAVFGLGIGGFAIACETGFYRRTCRLGMFASALVSIASLIVIGNN